MTDAKRERPKKRDHGLPWRLSAQGTNGGFERYTGKDGDGVPFDELVVGDWLHIERMNDHDWHIVIGKTHLNAHVTAKGATVMVVEGEVL